MTGIGHKAVCEVCGGSGVARAMMAAAVVRRQGAVLDESTIVSHCRAELASYKKPTVLWFVDELPMTAGRKVDKRSLRDSLLTSA